MLESLPSFLRHLAAQHRSGRTQKTYAAIVAAFFASTSRSRDATWAPSQSEVEAFLSRPLKEGGVRSSATRNQELAALRAFTAFAKRDLGWAEDPTDGIAFVKEKRRDPPVLSVFEIRRFFSLTSESSRGWQRERDLAVLALLAQLGLRVHELVGLDVDQIDVVTATLLNVHGKGGSRHDLPLNPPTVGLLEAWLEVRSGQAHPDEPALFVSARGRRISIRSVERFVERLRRLSGTKKRITPHTLRHSAATVSLTLGTDVSTVAELLRHTDLNTTRRYLHLIDERKREAVRRLAVVLPPEILQRARPLPLDVPSVREAPPAAATAGADPVPFPPNNQRKNEQISTDSSLDDQGDLGDAAEAA